MENLFLKFKIKTKNVKLFKEAFMHSTYVNEFKNLESYQRLEFLGDALIDAFAAKHLYNINPSLSEGEMTRLKARAVNKESLAQFSNDLKLSQYLKTGKSMNNLEKNSKILSDIFESFIAALFLDNQTKALQKILTITLFDYLDSIIGEESKDPKSLVQEHLQSHSRLAIEYRTVKDKESKNSFQSTLFHDGNTFGIGHGSTKKEAEINAAKEALRKLRIS